MASPSPEAGYRRWLDDTAAALPSAAPPPTDRDALTRRAQEIRRRMRSAERDALPRPGRRTPPAVEGRDVVEWAGCRVEKLLLETRPGTWATATLYTGPGGGRKPAVLCVHGHWAGARRDPVVQSRCLGLAKLGFVALTLDAWGAGERGTQAGRNEYHGGLLGASLWPVGTPLHGMQLHDNVRALDYLQAHPDVDPDRLGCTGASGGGNQTTYLSAFDPRIRCAVPVCSVGTFRDYLRAACCVDEVLDGALTFCEEGDLLGMVAPRALMVITATRDVHHFGPVSSKEAIDRARTYFTAHEAGDRLRHTLFESGHDYSRPMREAMYGWMLRWLKDEGDGSPVPEPAFETQPPESLRCADPASRPARVTTTVAWVQSRFAEQCESPRGSNPSQWPDQRRERLRALRSVLRMPPAGRTADEKRRLESGVVTTEPGMAVPISVRPDAEGATGVVLLLHPLGRAVGLGGELARRLEERGAVCAGLELRGCGELTLPGQALGEAIPDHNLAEWSLWIGRPLLGQWVHDARQALSALSGRGRRVAVVGWREAGLAALLLAALDSRVKGAAAIETLATYRTASPPHGQRIVVFPPGLLRAGDVPQLAALAAPRPVVVARPLRLDGMAAGEQAVRELYAVTGRTFGFRGHAERFQAGASISDRDVADQAAAWVLRGGSRERDR